jgi:hypothetical protein
MKSFHGVFILLPHPELVALGDKAPIPILNPSSRGYSIKHLSPEMKMIVRRFLLRKYKSQP